MKTTLIVIQNEADHADAKKLIEKLMGSSDSQDRARMVAQARLVEAYERAQWPRTAPALPVLLAYLMDQHNLSRADLVPLLGTAGRVSEVLTGKRDLSMTMVRRLRERFNVSADLLVSRGRARNRIAAWSCFSDLRVLLTLWAIYKCAGDGLQRRRPGDALLL
jgi:HTH-type transcriptional regulator/antitoxin HigA